MTRHASRGPRHSPGSARDRATIGVVTSPKVSERRRRDPVAGGAVASPATSLPTPTTGRTAVLVSVAVLLVLMLAVPVRAWFAQRAQIATLEAQIIAAQNDLGDLRDQQKQWKDPQFIERQARERLNYGRPGEVPLVVITPEGPVEPQKPGAPKARTWYEKLWVSVDGASGRADSEGPSIEIRDDAPR